MSSNGKGSRPRPQTKEQRQQFETNWDDIFKKKPVDEKPAERVTRMTKQEFDSLQEYSTTLPTSPSPGRRWKCGRPWNKPVNWFLGETYALPESDPEHKTQVGIRWSRIEIEG